jgi:hypothetical protein
MASSALPPIHDAARLWQGDEDATFRACVRHVRKKRPGWTLTWLRDSASFIFSGKMSKGALKQAIKANVPPDSRKSVWHAVLLLLKFIKAYGWQGVEIQSRDVPVGHDFTVKLRPIGKFISLTRKRKCLLALQPRLDNAPKYEQYRIWRSALHYEFCCDPLEPLEAVIVDLSRDYDTGKRQIRELGPTILPLLDKTELDQRLDLVARCYRRALEVVPKLPAGRAKPKSPGQSELF